VALRDFQTALGIPGWTLVLGLLGWFVVLVAWAAGAFKWSFAVFVGAIVSAAIATAWIAASVAKGKEVLRATRAAVVIVVSAAMPIVFDPHTGDVFNVPKYTLVVIGALVLAGLWVVAAVQYRSVPRWRNGLQWVVGAIVAWTLISALTSIDVRVSLLGNYGSYDGLYSAAAFGVIMMSAAEAFDALDIRKVLAAVGFAGGGVVTLYGLIQLHDSEVHGSTWDFIRWNLGSFANDIFSTFGNPNHLGGFLAIILPIVLVLGLGTRRWWWRAASGVFALVVIAELIRTSARGAWVAALVALAVLAAMLAPEIRRRPGLAAGGALGVVAVAAIGMLAGGKHFLAHPLNTLFQSGGSTSVQQRYDIWSAALHVVAHHPVTGVGPDAFALVYPQYQSAAWVAALGPNYLVNGAHDIFMNFLADQGFVGLLLFLGLLALIGLRSIGAWRRLRSLERGKNVTSAVKDQAQVHRVTVAVVTASVVAYIVQATFNVQQVGLSFCFWLLVGTSTVLASAAGVPDTLRPGVLVSAVPGDGALEEVTREAGGAVGPVPAWAPRSATRRKRQNVGRRQEVPWPGIIAGVVGAALVVLVIIGADGPLRADHDYWAAYSSLKQPAPGSSTATPASQSTQVGATYFGDLKSSFSLNPWEASYKVEEADVLTNAATHVTNQAQLISDLQQARGLLDQAVAEKPLWAPYPAAAAEVYADLAEVEPANAQAELVTAASLAHKAVHDNPRDAAYPTLLSQIVARQHKASK
jgi:O-antigen ligase